MDCDYCEHRKGGKCEHPAVVKGYSKGCPFPDKYSVGVVV